MERRIGRTLILLGFMLVVNSMGTGTTSLIRPEITQRKFVFATLSQSLGAQWWLGTGICDRNHSHPCDRLRPWIRAKAAHEPSLIEKNFICTLDFTIASAHFH